MQKIADVRFSSAVLEWDQETYLPAAGAERRGKQIATLSEISHQLFTDEETGGMLRELAGRNDLAADQLRNVELSLQDYEREKKLPSPFVHELSEATNISFHAWLRARKANDFSVFREALKNLVTLKKRQADYLGYLNHPYDALMDEYDRGLSTALVDELFKGLMPRLNEILNKVRGAAEIDKSVLHGHFEKDRQWKFGIHMLKAMHYDFSAGRQDISEHPFTTHFNSRDVRVTTRIDEQDFGNMTWSCLHEGGHALYEQGLPEDEYGLPLGESCSLSIHESQSRLWENCIGRSRSFWQHHFPHLQRCFPERLKSTDADGFFRAINKISPSLIRTESDEVTYHFHILIRYEIEKELISGALSADDIPARWKEMYKKHLGLEVTDDRNGCLQDVHWSHGSFGYFPTYSLGSLYAAQFFSVIQRECGDLEKIIAAGNTLPVWNWLQKNIYNSGRRFRSAELCQHATGSEPDTSFYLDYIARKIKDVYGV